MLGPAVAFDKDSRGAMQGLIENGYCHALLAGNALATHDLEAAHFGTGLGQDIYTQTLQPWATTTISTSSTKYAEPAPSAGRSRT